MPNKIPPQNEVTFDFREPDYISEYRERFGHRVPIAAARDPDLIEKLKTSLETGTPIERFKNWPHKTQGDYFVDENS